MKYKEIRQNIVNCPEGINIILHQANINKRMGSGVALALKSKWPIVAEVDINTAHDINPLGTFTACEVQNDNGDPLFIFNVYGQSLYEDSMAGCRTSNDAVVSSLNLIKMTVRSWELNHGFKPVIGVPKFMGSALAGGNWNIYSTILKEAFADTDWTLVVVDFNQYEQEKLTNLRKYLKF